MFFRLLFRLSVSAIVLIIIGNLLLAVLPLEITSAAARELVEMVSVVGLSVAIMLTLTGTIKPGAGAATIIGRVVLTFLLALIPFAWSLLTLFSGMCGWSDNKILFENRGNASIKIVLRDHGCGATDSSPPSFAIFRIRYITPQLVWVSTADTSRIRMDQWRRIQ